MASQCRGVRSMASQIRPAPSQWHGTLPKKARQAPSQQSRAEPKVEIKAEAKVESEEEPKVEPKVKPKAESEEEANAETQGPREPRPVQNRDWANAARAADISAAMARAAACSHCSWRGQSKGCKRCLGRWGPFYRLTEASQKFWAEPPKPDKSERL